MNESEFLKFDGNQTMAMKILWLIITAFHIMWVINFQFDLAIHLVDKLGTGIMWM